MRGLPIPLLEQQLTSGANVSWNSLRTSCLRLQHSTRAWWTAKGHVTNELNAGEGTRLQDLKSSRKRSQPRYRNEQKSGIEFNPVVSISACFVLPCSGGRLGFGAEAVRRSPAGPELSRSTEKEPVCVRNRGWSFCSSGVVRTAEREAEGSARRTQVMGRQLRGRKTSRTEAEASGMEREDSTATSSLGYNNNEMQKIPL